MKFRTGAICAVALSLAACSATDDALQEFPGPEFWQETDDFAGMDSVYLDVSIWIDREKGQYLDLQFQCRRHEGAMYSIEQNLFIASRVVEGDEYGRAVDIGAVLYKRDQGSPSAYDFGYQHIPSEHASLDLSHILSPIDEGKYPESIQIRFVYDIGYLRARRADIPDLSRADSVDFVLSTDNPEAAKFLKECYPVENWTPPASEAE
ncbi:hypothetical protein KUV75_07205 [Qipengyuania gaetbuli]|uniref:hypothetical protein n=1 Tax=Qipengyuania gaetbuli TaxID=266952 RepID=UPI001C99BD1E|nr:hypothetical protein [Qipengyuania gaetbuli]MBY6014686.1 hypothetical protein [Qipengyuania gaetbuli]